jgi:sporulation protein YlmC with PRC-barrel domain
VEDHNGTATTWPYWLLPLAALAGLGWYLMSGDQWRQQTAEAPRTPVAGTDRPSLTVGGVDLGRQTAAAADNLGNLLRGIRDQASASAALPKLQEAAKELDRMASMSDQLSQEARTALAGSTSSALAKLNTALDTAAGVPGVAPLLQPTLDRMRGRIDMIAMAPPAGRPYFAAAPGDWVLLSSLLDRDVSSASGERLGRVNEVLLAPDGRMAALIVGVERNLGIGEKVIAIPFNAARMQGRADGTRLVIDATREGLAKAPAYQPKR